MLSAKGAAFTASLWQRPRILGTEKAPALKARFTSGQVRYIIGAMPQSLSRIILHIIFSTKNREPWLDSHVRPRMHAYLATICRDAGAEVVRVGGVADHVHIVTTLARTVSQAQLIEQIRKTFSKSLPSAPPPRPATGERIACRAVAQRRREVRGIRTFWKTR